MDVYDDSTSRRKDKNIPENINRNMTNRITNRARNNNTMTISFHFLMMVHMMLLHSSTCFLQVANAFQMMPTKRDMMRTSTAIIDTTAISFTTAKVVSREERRQSSNFSINRNNHHTYHQVSHSKLHLGFWDKDTQEITTTTKTPPSPPPPPARTQKNTNVNNINKKPLFQPGTGPTIIIEPNEPGDLIYASAISRTISWITAAALFGLGLYLSFGPDTSEEFFAGYLVEQSLSIDNLFVFLLLFDYFNVPLQNQDRVLNYGIYGAIVMRALMIGLGSVALSQYHGILLIFAGILIYSSANVLLNLVTDGNEEEEKEEEDMSENSIVKFSRNLFDSSKDFDGDNFFTIENGIKKATPLLICLVAVEISDVVFAVDSIPAVFGVTENPLIVFSSNMFAIMGLRSLYTILSKAAQDLEYLEPAVAIVLGFIGSKMVAEYFGIIIPTELSLGVVLTFLSGGIGLSVYKKNNQNDLESSSGIK